MHCLTNVKHTISTGFKIQSMLSLTSVSRVCESVIEITRIPCLQWNIVDQVQAQMMHTCRGEENPYTIGDLRTWLSLFPLKA